MLNSKTLLRTHPFRCQKPQGFTLIELVVVMGILAALLAIVLVAINPARQFAQANNTQRRSDVNAILNAVHQYAAANRGALPAGITTTEKVICKPITTCGALTPNAVDLCSALAPIYIADLPRDPTGTVAPTGNTSCQGGATPTTAYDTTYTVVSTGASAGNRITVRAPAAELTETISVTR